MNPEKMCKICGEEAGTKKKFYSHYGAICCMGCKAFFRRIHQNKIKNDQLICKGTKNCLIQPLKRVKCMHCRYKKCLAIGMKPEMVLTGELRIKFTHCNLRKNVEKNMIDHGAIMVEKPIKVRAELKAMANSLMNLYSTAEREHDTNGAHSVFEGDLTSTWSPQHNLEVIVRIFNQLPQLFKRYAQSISFLKSLGQSDQDLLISNNTHLFTGYIMARYLGAESGLDQLSWILGKKALRLSLSSIQKLDLLSFDVLNREGLIIPLNEEMTISCFKQSYELIRANFKYPQFHTGIIAFYLLFATDHWSSEHLSRLIESKRINGILQFAEALVNLGCDSQFAKLTGSNKLGQLVHTLQTMTNLINSRPTLLPKCSLALASNFDWLEEKLAIHDQALVKNPVPLNYIRILIEFTLGKTYLRPQVNLFTFNLLSKRLQCMVDLLTPEMKERDKLTLMRSNVHKSLVLMMVKSSTFDTFQEQIDFVTGPSHRLELPGIIEPLSMDKMNSKNPIFKKHERFKQSQLKRDIGTFIKEKEILVITLYLVILDLPDNNEVANLRAMFYQMLAYKLKQFGCQDPMPTLNWFLNTFQEFCMLMQKMNQEVEESLDRLSQ